MVTALDYLRAHGMLPAAPQPQPVSTPQVQQSLVAQAIAQRVNQAVAAQQPRQPVPNAYAPQGMASWGPQPGSRIMQLQPPAQVPQTNTTSPDVVPMTTDAA